MNNIEIEQYNEKLKELGHFIVSKDEFIEKEIINWIADCVVVFSEIGVNGIIIDDFLKFCGYKTEKIKVTESMLIIQNSHHKQYVEVKHLGPFREIVEDTGSRIPTIPTVRHGCYKLHDSSYYVRVAFAAAQAIFKKKIEEERIVHNWIVDYFSDDKYSHVLASLELIEKAYQDRNSDGLLSNTITLLDSILNFDNELKEKQKLSGKLNAIIENKNKLKSLGLSKDVVYALSNFRIIRNEKIDHKELPLKYDIPFQIAASFSYLAVYFLEVLILNGEIFKE